jgi:predicted TIM-barrel fold metal-dependent hydrolase
MVSVLDAHVHVVSGDTTSFPVRPAPFGRDWWSGRSVDAATVTRDLDGAGVERAVIVQAVGPYGNDNRYARSVVEQAAGRFALVAAIDTDGDDPAAEADGLLADGFPVGLRLAALHGEAAWLADERAGSIWDVAHARDTTLVVACLAPHLPALGDVVARHPDVRVVLDHCAFPDLRGGHPYPHAGPLLELASQPAIHLKVSTIVLLAARAAGGTSALVNRLVEDFGAARLCWGSDHPQSHELGYHEMVQLARDAVRDLEPAAQAALLAATASDLWFGGH